MGEMTSWDNVKCFIMHLWPCKLLGHRFKYEPMEGDEPPFEFDHCAICGKPNLELQKETE